MEFTVNKNGIIFCFRASSWRSEIGKITPSKLTALNKLEHDFFRMYSAGVKVNIDSTTECYNEWNRYEY